MFGRVFEHIHARVVLIAVLPLTVITAALTWFTLNERRGDLLRALEQQGRTTTEYIATAGEFSLFAGDAPALRRLARGALRNNAITAVAYFDTSGATIATEGETLRQLPDVPRRCDGAQLWKKTQRWLFCQPVTGTVPDIDDYDLENPRGDEAPPVYGYVLVSLTTEHMLQQQREVVALSLGVALLGLLVSIAVALRIGRSISEPVMRLTDTVRRMEEGTLSTRHQTTDGPAEVRFLAGGINRLAEAVEESQTNLERKIQSATAKLTRAMHSLTERNTELENIRDELEAAINAKDQFLARMSHELRTPLTTVIGFSRLLNHSSLNDQQSEYSQNINQASTLLLATIDDILNYAKLQANALELEHIDFELRDALEDLVAMHAYQAYGKALELVLIIDSDVPARLNGDPMRLKQIVNNLLSNAIKFTERGEVVLRVSQLDSARGRVQLEFSVRDSGVGISAAQKARLFQPFSQADTSITRQYGGTGLGLVICKQLVELMGGQIDIDSEPGIGTEVSFQLWLAQTATAPASEPALEDLQLLVYDQNPWSRRAIRNQLLQWLSRLYVAGSTAQCHQLLQQPDTHFDLMVLGLQAGDMDSARLTEILADLRIHYRGPILLLACISNVQSRISDAIFSDYAPLYCLSKPARREALQGILELLRGGARPAPAASEPAPDADHCLRDITVLVADDNRYNRQLIRSVIELFGGTVLEAENGHDAVALAQAGSVDAVLMDVHMPAMDGIEASRQIRAAQPELPVIGLTANMIDNEEQALREAGVETILYKPLDEQQLIATLCRQSQREFKAAPGGKHSIFSARPDAVPALKEELSRLIHRIRELLEQQELLRCREAVHELLGLAGLFGMHELRIFAKDLQKAVHGGRYDQAAQLVTRIESEIVSFRNTPAIS